MWSFFLISSMVSFECRSFAAEGIAWVFTGLVQGLACWTEIEFLVKFSAWPLHFTIIHGFMWLWMGHAYKSALWMLVFFRAPVLVLLFSCYTLTIFLMVLLVILPLMLMMVCLSNLVCFQTQIWPTRYCGLG